MKGTLFLLAPVLLVAGGCGGRTSLEPIGPPPDAGASGSALRLVAPLSTATVTSRRPTLHWQLAGGADGAHVELCRDRACAMPLATFDADGASGAPAADLPPGVVFWHASPRLAGTTMSAVGTPTWQFTVGARSAPVDTSWGSTLDINGDGFADLAVGAPGANRVYIYFGGPAGLGPDPAVTLTGPAFVGRSGFGDAVVSAGDLNGDGFADLAVPDLGARNGSGAVFIYFGGASGPATVPDATLVSPDSVIYFAESAAGAGDVDGDGYADLVVGGSVSSIYHGRAFLFLGRASAFWPTPDAVLVGPDAANDHFGLSLGGAGDVNGDGFADVVVGSEGAHGTSGAAYLFQGGSPFDPLAPPAELVAPSGISTELLGADVAGAGDVNGDGYADVLVRGSDGAPGADNVVLVYLGGPTGLVTTAATTLEQAGGGHYERSGSTTAAADVNRDGYGDVVVGDPLRNGMTGVYSVYLGSPAGLLSAPAATLAPPTAGEGRFGEPVAGAGDVDGDAYADIAIGATDTKGGTVYVYLGSGAGAAAVPPVALTAPDGPSSGFGASLATTY
jgi:hypothetical protein